MKILTANRLSDGKVVYRTTAGWTTQFDAASRFDPEAAKVALADAQGQSGEFVAPYLVEVDGAEIEKRERLRESIRAAGPTVGHSLGWRAG